MDLNDVWANELAFSDWLAANIDRLSNALGISMIARRREAPVERFSADILAMLDGSAAHVVIENQIFRADHGHLGQLVTYAAHYDAEVVIWIARHFRSEYRRALAWLNDLSEKTFYAVELRGSGPEDAEFAVVSGREVDLSRTNVPNVTVVPTSSATRRTAHGPGAYVPVTMAVSNDESASPGQLVLNRIFEQIGTMLHEAAFYPRLRKPTNDRNYYVVARGPVPGSEWAVTFEPNQVGAGVVFNGPEAPSELAALSFRREQFQAAMNGLPLTFVERGGVHKKKVLVFKPVSYAQRQDDGDALAAWAVDVLIKMGNAVRSLDAF